MADNVRVTWLLRASVVVLVVGAVGLVAIDATPEAGVVSGNHDDAITVVSSHQYKHYQSRLFAFQDGETIYASNLRWDQYFDVDPAPNTSHSVETVAVDSRHCAANATACYDIAFVRLNLSTGESEVVWNRTMVGPTIAADHGYRYHDIDRVNETHIAVADIRYDRVFLVDVATGREVWTWHANGSFSHDSGGTYPDDWTHLNDVEVLSDGRLMVSLRNQDQVVFLKDGAVQPNWTLGCDGCYDTLYEQHNPDYIPAERGGPAILVADSENNRVLEYHRQNGAWRQHWAWSGRSLHWPRDADRLPNNHTLIVNSNGNRIVEVTPEGRTVWSARVPTPYDVERLGTGDESAASHTLSTANKAPRPTLGKVRNGILFILPMGISIPEAGLLVACGLFVLVWAVWEWRQW